jgi:hypothetical protein
MRILSIFGLPFLVAALSAAPPAGPVGAPFSSQSNALGGHFGAAGTGRPLGGIVSPGQRRGSESFRNRGAVSTYPYAFSWYTPSYFDDAPPPAPPPDLGPPPMIPPQQPPQPVIINQYFTAPPPQQASSQQDQSQPPAGAPIGPVENYYLIAYKDHSVYPAISFWVEDKTFHYVTTQNTHNQASLDLIDLDLTRNLNQARNVPFNLPGH